MNKLASVFVTFSALSSPLLATPSNEGEIRLAVVTSITGDEMVKRIVFHIPQNLKNPNVDTQRFPGIPLLIQTLTQGDYEATLELLDHPNIDVNQAEWRISAMAGGKPSGLTALIAAIGQADTHSSQESEFAMLLAGRDLEKRIHPIDVTKRLLELGADANKVAAGGFSALHAAVNNNKITASEKAQIIDLLLAKGADLKATWGQYGTPKDLALRLNLETIQPDVFAKL